MTGLGEHEDGSPWSSFRFATCLAQYYEANYREIGDAWEVGSTASTGSSGSRGSGVPEIRLEKRTAETVYFA